MPPRSDYIIAYTPIPFSDEEHWRTSFDVLFYLVSHPAERERLMNHARERAKGESWNYLITHPLLGDWRLSIHSEGDDHAFLQAIQTLLLYKGGLWYEIPGLESDWRYLIRSLPPAALAE